MSGQKIINLINHKIAICSGKNLSTTSIDAIVYSRNGCPIAIASKGLTAEDLLPHTATIAKTCYSNPSGVVAHPDCQLFRVKLNGVPAKDQYERFIPADQILKHLVTTQYFSDIPWTSGRTPDVQLHARDATLCIIGHLVPNLGECPDVFLLLQVKYFCGCLTLCKGHSVFALLDNSCPTRPSGLMFSLFIMIQIFL